MALAGAADAAIVTTDDQVLTFGIPGGGLKTDYSASDTFALFNSSLGTLQSVTVYATYQINSSLGVLNTATSSSSGSVRATSDLTLSSTISGIDQVLQNLYRTVDDEVDPGVITVLSVKQNYSLASGGSASFTSNSSTVSSNIFTATSDLSAFQTAGSGTGSVDAKTHSQTLQSNDGGNTSSSQATLATPTFHIRYTYDDSSAAAVPESATWAMMLAGFGAMGFALRRRRSPTVRFG